MIIRKVIIKVFVSKTKTIMMIIKLFKKCSPFGGNGSGSRRSRSSRPFLLLAILFGSFAIKMIPGQLIEKSGFWAPRRFNQNYGTIFEQKIRRQAIASKMQLAYILANTGQMYLSIVHRKSKLFGIWYSMLFNFFQFYSILYYQM